MSNRIRPGTIIARAPLRVSLAGGGTDLPGYASRYGGAVIGFAIDRYVAVTVHPQMLLKGVRVSVEDTVEHVTSASELANPFVRAALHNASRLTGPLPAGGALQVTSLSDVPSGTGLGGSGAFLVALLHALLYSQQPVAAELAERASSVEQVDLGRPVGKQDHYFAALGGLRVLHIGRDQRVDVESLTVHPAFGEYVRDRLLLFYTGVRRCAAAALHQQEKGSKVGNPTTLRMLREIHSLVPAMVDAVTLGRVDEIGALLGRHWDIKQNLSPARLDSQVQQMINVALSSGAEGVKLVGAGGGGFLLVSTTLTARAQIRASLSKLGAIELTFDLQPGGSGATALPL